MEHQIELESLSAKNKLDQESAFYLSTLDKVLKEKNNKNIAITGGYGAGKTTIIDSYFEEYEDRAKEMMRISIEIGRASCRERVLIRADREEVESTRERRREDGESR